MDIFPRKIYKWLNILLITTAAAKSLQSCLTLCDPIDSNPAGSPIPGILQAKTMLITREM